MSCKHCFGEHEPDTPDAYVEYANGKRIFAPFNCVCCGIETCGRQFAFGARCGVCDTGACDPRNKSYQPEYAHTPIQEMGL